MPGVSIESVGLPTLRHTITRFCPNPTVTVIPANSLRRKIRLSVGSNNAGDFAILTVAGINNVGTQIQFPMLLVNPSHPTDTLDYYDDGDIVLGAFQVQVAGVADAYLFETVLQ